MRGPGRADSHSRMPGLVGIIARGPMRYRSTTYVCAVCGMAVLYYLAGRLGLLLAIPPGYATAVWPPSGIALAGLLLFGGRIWPGVFIGSFALNIWTSLDPTDPTSRLRSLLIASSIAAGSTLQAFLGQRLVRWISGGPDAKPWERRRELALVLGGPIACLAAATLGVTTLALTGAIKPGSIPYSWMTWYVGDTIGVVIFTPILLLWAARPNRIPIHRRLAATAPLVVTFTLVVLLFTRVSALEQHQIRMKLEQRSGMSWGILAAGMAFTGLLGAYILSLLGQSAIVERLVALRTEELRRANEEAKSAQLKLVQSARLESVGRLAAGVAHEVKNPLAVILFAIDYLKESVRSPDPNVAVALTDAREAVVRADGVIRDLLDFSTGAELKPSMQDINDVVQKALLLVRHAITRAHIHVVEELEPGLPPVMIDRNKIEQVLVNLIINAIDAMPHEGRLTVRTRRERPQDIRSEAGAQTDPFQAGTSAIVVEIEDSGTGIDEGSEARIFDPFYTTKPAGKGSGLGLAVSRSIVALHGGSIGIVNKEGGGGARAIVVLRSVRPKEEGIACA